MGQARRCAFSRARLVPTKNTMVSLAQRQHFERLYAEHAGALLRYLTYQTGDPALAEDLFSDTFERVLRAPRFVPRRAKEKTWIYTIALNCLRDHVRREAAKGRALQRVEASAASPEWGSGIATVEARVTVLGALEVLSTEEREALALRFGADLSLPEIARLTGERLTTVEGRVYRAVRKLRDELE